MKFEVCEPWEKVRNYIMTEAALIVFAVVVALHNGPAVVRAIIAGNTIVIAFVSAVALCLIYSFLGTRLFRKFKLTINEKERTITISRFLRPTRTVGILEINSWKVKVRKIPAGRILYLRFSGGRVKVKSYMENWETLRKYLCDNASDRLEGEEGRETTKYSFMSEADKLENYEDDVICKIMDITGHFTPDDKCVDSVVFKTDSGTIPDGFRAALKSQWLGDGFEDEKKIIDSIEMEIIGGCNSLDELFDIMPKKPDANAGEVLEKKNEFKKYLTEEFGQPMAFNTVEKPLDKSISKAIADSTHYDDILDIHFVLFAEYTIGLVIGREE